MLKTMLYDLNKCFMKTDCNIIVCCPNENKNLRISSKTDDSQFYIYAESVANDWEYKEFAFRDWASVSTIISSFYEPNNPENCIMKLERDAEDYPNILKVKNGRMEMTHYLQNYSFISKQTDMLNTYKSKKFTLQNDGSGFINFDTNNMTKISRLSSLTGEKSFKIKKIGTDLYFCFGDETKTIDNGKILVKDNFEESFTDKDLFFNVDYFGIAVNALKDQDLMIKFEGGLITFTGSNDVSKKIIALTGKKEN